MRIKTNVKAGASLAEYPMQSVVTAIYIIFAPLLSR
jgi:hypothetical protein